MEREAYEKLAKEKGESLQTVKEVKADVELDDEDEGSFDFDAMSDEEGLEKPMEKPMEKPVEKSVEKPVEVMPVVMEEEDEDGSEDLVNYDMPEIEEGELDKIIDPLANETVESEPSGRRKRTRAKVDYVALEAQLKKEEEEMRNKQRKQE